MIAARRSEQEWIASEIILILPHMNPAISLKMISAVFDVTDNDAANFLFFKNSDITL